MHVRQNVWQHGKSVGLRKIIIPYSRIITTFTRYVLCSYVRDIDHCYLRWWGCWWNVLLKSLCKLKLQLVWVKSPFSSQCNACRFTLARKWNFDGHQLYHTQAAKPANFGFCLHVNTFHRNTFSSIFTHFSDLDLGESFSLKYRVFNNIMLQH